MAQQAKTRTTGRQKTRLRACSALVGLLWGASATFFPAWAEVPATRLAILARGINITHWFRFPPNNHAQAMAGDVSDAGLAALKQAGFTYIRLAVGPEEVMQGQNLVPDKLAAIISVVGRIEQAGLGVMIEPHPELMQHWNLQRNAQARENLLGFWRDLAPALKQFSTRLTFPELVNEPGFDDPGQWDIFQRQLLVIVRAALPDSTIILTGTNWSSIDGLLKTQPVADQDVIYSFHTYEPQLLTLLGFWDPAIRKGQLARYLPFPIKDQASCKAEVSAIEDPHTLAIAQYWCSTHQDAASISKNLARATNWGHVHHVVVAMTEFGAADKLKASSRLAYLASVREGAEKLGLPWAIWGLDDQMGFGQRPGGFNSTSQLPPDILQALGLNS